MTETAPDAPEKQASTTSRSRRGVRVAGWCLGTMFLVTGGVILTLALLIGRPVQAPDWLRENIETRIAGMMRGGGILDLGGIEVTLDRGLTPTVRLSNLTIHEPGGARLGDLADTRVVLSRAALL